MLVVFVVWSRDIEGISKLPLIQPTLQDEISCTKGRLEIPLLSLLVFVVLRSRDIKGISELALIHLTL